MLTDRSHYIFSNITPSLPVKGNITSTLNEFCFGDETDTVIDLFYSFDDELEAFQLHGFSISGESLLCACGYKG